MQSWVDTGSVEVSQEEASFTLQIVKNLPVTSALITVQ